jgi:PASTA domain
MYRRITVLAARRRAVALVAALGAATALLVATPLAPAHAAGAADTTSTAPAAAPTVSFTAHAAAGGTITPFSNPSDITCTLTIYAPTPRGADFAHSDVFGEALTTCRYDLNGSLATVPLIDMSEQLLLDNTLVSRDHKTQAAGNAEFAFSKAQPCSYGNWTNNGQVVITFPPGYVPQTVSGSGTHSIFIGLGDCPGDHVEVPDVTGVSVSLATADLQAAGLVVGGIGTTVSCEVPRNTIASTEPPAGTLVLLGSTVTMRKSVGLPATPCP